MPTNLPIPPAHLRTQLFNHDNQQTSLITERYPLYFGAATVHRCWIHTVVSTGKQKFYAQLWDNNNKQWLAPKSKFVADIILLYRNNDLTDTNYGLPFTLSLTIIYAALSNKPSHEPSNEPTRQSQIECFAQKEGHIFSPTQLDFLSHHLSS